MTLATASTRDTKVFALKSCEREFCHPLLYKQPNNAIVYFIHSFIHSFIKTEGLQEDRCAVRTPQNEATKRHLMKTSEPIENNSIHYSMSFLSNGWIRFCVENMT